MPLETLGQGKYLRLLRDGRWEFVRRINTTGVVVIVAVTDDGRLLLTEQHRASLKTTVVELPAGLVGDVPGTEEEDLATAARRELLEETGFEAAQMIPLVTGPPTAGMSDEVVTFFRAVGLRRIGDGGGDDSEQITVHEVPVASAAMWLQSAIAAGKLVDPKVYAGLYFAEH